MTAEMRGSRGGFTLVELMIVLAIISVLVAIAVPGILQARMRANEASIIGLLRQVLAAQTTFKERDYDKDGLHDYATSMLQLKGLIDEDLALRSETNGYQFRYLNPTAQNRRENFRLRVTCLQPGRAGENGYFIDATGVIRVCKDNAADETDPPLQ